MVAPACIINALSVLALLLQLFATISTPLTHSLYLAQYNGYMFGVFGWCKSNGICTSVSIGYSEEQVSLLASGDEFSLPTHARYSLSKLLIAHPVAMASTGLLCALNMIAHTFQNNHKLITVAIIWSFITYMQVLFCFLLDILLFVPHLAWPGWLMLMSTLLIGVSICISCSRRTLSSSRTNRKANVGEELHSLKLNRPKERACRDTAGVQI